MFSFFVSRLCTQTSTNVCVHSQLFNYVPLPADSNCSLQLCTAQKAVGNFDSVLRYLYLGGQIPKEHVIDYHLERSCLTSALHLVFAGLLPSFEAGLRKKKLFKFGDCFSFTHLTPGINSYENRVDVVNIRGRSTKVRVNLERSNLEVLIDLQFFYAVYCAFWALEVKETGRDISPPSFFHVAVLVMYVFQGPGSNFKVMSFEKFVASCNSPTNISINVKRFFTNDFLPASKVFVHQDINTEHRVNEASKNTALISSKELQELVSSELFKELISELES